MFSIKLSTLYLFLCYVVWWCQACMINGVTECNMINTVNEMHFFAFIPANKWAEQCRNRKIAIDCIYHDKYVGGCSIKETSFYDMQRDLRQQVCSDGEYQKHGCLGSQTLDEEVHISCIQPLEDELTIDCPVLQSTRACISSKIMTKCGEDDSKYIDRLAYYFLKPRADEASCKLIEPVFQIATTLPTTVKTMSTKMVDKTTTNAEKTGTTSSQHGGNGQHRVTSTLFGLIIQIIFVIVLVEN